MNNSPFFYSLPFHAQHQNIFSHLSNSPYFLMMTPLCEIQPFQTYNYEIQEIPSTNFCKSAVNSCSQESQVLNELEKSYSSAEDSSQILKEKKKHRIQRLRDDKGRYYGIRKLPIKQKYKQNPKRNVITNIGNQLLAFASNKSKSHLILRQSNPSLKQQQISHFYQFMVELRKGTDYYLNIIKMKQIWYPMNPDANQAKINNRSLFRILSYYYLNNLIHLFVLNSAKIKKSSKIYHIKAIKSLLNELVPKRQL